MQADPDCRHCGGAGWFVYSVRAGDPRFGQLQRCTCLEASAHEARAAAAAERASFLTASLAGELGRLRGSTFATFRVIAAERPLPADVEWQGLRDEAPRRYTPDEQRRLLMRAYALAKGYEPRDGLYLCGSYGSGKSHLAAAIANAAAGAGIETRYATIAAMLRLVRGGFRDHTADERLQALMTVPLLVLDDLGTEHESSWAESSLFELVNARYTAGRATVYTSNIRPQDLRDPRLTSRIHGSCELVELVAYDYRLLGQSEAA